MSAAHADTSGAAPHPQQYDERIEFLGREVLLRPIRPDLCGDVIDRVPGLAARAAHVKQYLREKLLAHKAYIEAHGEDMPEIRNWRWGATARA